MASILKAVRVGSSGLFGRLKHKSEFNLAFFVEIFFCGILFKFFYVLTYDNYSKLIIYLNNIFYTMTLKLL